MLCKNRITLIAFLGQDAENRSTPSGTVYTRFSVATNVSWKEKGSNEYKTRTEWHRVTSWSKLAEWAGTLHPGVGSLGRQPSFATESEPADEPGD